MTSDELEALINSLDALGTIDGATDLVPIVDTSASTLKKTTRNTYLGLASAPLGTTDSQNPTNKTFDNSNTFTIRDDRLTLQDNSDTTKQVVFQLSGITTGTIRTLTIPDASTTLVGTTATQTLTNKTLTSPTINSPTISNPTITVDSIAEYTSANGVSIDGMLIKDGHPGPGTVVPNSLTASSGTSWVWQDWTPTWTNLTLGNGTQVAKYVQIGKNIDFRISISLGSTSSVGTDPSFSLPGTAASSYLAGTVNGEYIGSAMYVDFSTAANPGFIRLFTTTTGGLVASQAGGSYTNAASVTATAPFTFGTSDRIFIRGTFEVA